METSKPLCTALCSALLSWLWADFSIYLVRTLIYAHCLSSPPCNALGTRLCFLDDLLAGAAGQLSCLPKALSSPKAKQSSFLCCTRQHPAGCCSIICTPPCLFVALSRDSMSWMCWRCNYRMGNGVATTKALCFWRGSVQKWSLLREWEQRDDPKTRLQTASPLSGQDVPRAIPSQWNIFS